MPRAFAGRAFGAGAGAPAPPTGEGEYTRILEAVQAAVQGLGLADAARTLPVVIRKVPGSGTFTETPPLVVVCPSEGGESDEAFSTEDQVLIKYGVDVIVIGPAKGDPTNARLDEWFSARQRIRRLFQGGFLPGVPGVFKVDVRPLSPVDRARWAAYVFSGVKFLFWQVEPRQDTAAALAATVAPGG